MRAIEIEHELFRKKERADRNASRKSETVWKQQEHEVGLQKAAADTIQQKQYAEARRRKAEQAKAVRRCQAEKEKQRR